MPQGKRKRPLETWPDDQKHKAAESPEEADEESMEGSMPKTGSDEAEDLDKNLKEEGIYEDADNPEGPPEVGIDKQIEKNDEG